jgi:hypothetical protein
MRVWHRKICVPVTFGDEIALVVANRPPIYGNTSLAPMLQAAQPATEPLVPVAFTAFIDSPPDT